MNNLTIWTDSHLEARLLDSLSMMDNQKQMPSAKDLRAIGMNDLAVAIGKHGGYAYWAERIGLSQKESETLFGQKYEKYFKKYIFDIFGWQSEKMLERFPYDFLVEKMVKVDVKSSRIYIGKSGSFYTFNLETKHRKSDFIVAYCIADDLQIAKTYVVPSIVLEGKTQLSVGEIRSKYDNYLNRFDIINEYLEFFKGIIGKEYSNLC